jgi:hypothetical protein
MTSRSSTLVPLSDDRLRYSANDLATLNDLSATDQGHINTTFMQELYQALAKSLGLA